MSESYVFEYKTIYLNVLIISITIINFSSAFFKSFLEHIYVTIHPSV